MAAGNVPFLLALGALFTLTTAPFFLAACHGRMVGKWVLAVLLCAGLIAGSVLVVAPVTAQFASFVREHKITRQYANPRGYTYALISPAQPRRPVLLLMIAYEQESKTCAANDSLLRHNKDVGTLPRH